MTQTKKRTVVARTTSAPRVDSSYPSLTEEALGQLKLSWRLSNEADDWTKGGRISDEFDRWTFWPYMAKFTYDLTYTSGCWPRWRRRPRRGGRFTSTRGTGSSSE